MERRFATYVEGQLGTPWAERPPIETRGFCSTAESAGFENLSTLDGTMVAIEGLHAELSQDATVYQAAVVHLGDVLLVGAGEGRASWNTVDPKAPVLMLGGTGVDLAYAVDALSSAREGYAAFLRGIAHQQR